VAIAALMLCGSAASARTASAAGLTPLTSIFPIDHANPEASIPSVAARNAKPLEFGYFLQDLVTFAEAAGRAGDHVSEARYYRAFTKAVPDAVAGFSRLCTSLESAHQRDEALVACRKALGLGGATLEDHVRFVRLVLARPGPLGPAERDDVNAVIAHLRESPDTRVAASHLQCELGVHLESIPLLAECTAALAAIAPSDPKTLTFEWALAIRQGDAARARALIGRARAFGLKDESLARMERATDALEGAWRHRLVDGRALLATALIAAIGLGAIYARRRRSAAAKLAITAELGSP
jgi:hypothetical protein